MDKFLIRVSMALALLFGLYLWSAGYLSPRYESYSMPMAEVHDTLSRTPLPPVFFGSDPNAAMPQFTSALPTKMKVEKLSRFGDDNGMPRNFTIDASKPNRIAWTVTRNKRPVFKLVADLTADGERSTRIAVSVTTADGDGSGKIAERIAKYPEIANMYVTAMKEQIAASLEDRDFNMATVYPAMMAAAAVNMHKIHSNMLRGIEADNKRRESNIERAYKREAYDR